MAGSTAAQVTQMSATSYKRIALLTASTTVLLLLCLCYLGSVYNRERMEARTVWSVMADYERSRQRLSRDGVEDTVTLLDVVVHASSNLRNRQLNLILGKEKAQFVAEIIQSLRTKTGKDLGDNPEKWIAALRREPPN